MTSGFSKAGIKVLASIDIDIDIDLGVKPTFRTYNFKIRYFIIPSYQPS